MNMPASIDLRDDENQLLLIGLALAEAIDRAQGPAAGRLLEKLAGERADEFRAFVREDVLAIAAKAVDAACALAVVNWIDAPPHVEAIIELLKFSVTCDLADFEDRTNQYHLRRRVEQADEQREFVFDGGADLARLQEERLDREGAHACSSTT